MPYAPDLKQAGACGRRPGQFSGAGAFIHRTQIAQPCLQRPRNHETILLISFSSNFEKAFYYPFLTVSGRVGLDFGLWIVMLQ